MGHHHICSVTNKNILKREREREKVRKKLIGEIETGCGVIHYSCNDGVHGPTAPAPAAVLSPLEQLEK